MSNFVTNARENTETNTTKENARKTITENAEKNNAEKTKTTGIEIKQKRSHESSGKQENEGKSTENIDTNSLNNKEVKIRRIDNEEKTELLEINKTQARDRWLAQSPSRDYMSYEDLQDSQPPSSSGLGTAFVKLGTWMGRT